MHADDLFDFLAGVATPEAKQRLASERAKSDSIVDRAIRELRDLADSLLYADQHSKTESNGNEGPADVER